MNIENHLSAFSHINRDEKYLLDSAVSYFGVKEKKYLLKKKHIKKLIASIQKEYVLLEIDGKTTFHYEDIYFDSKDFLFYFQQLDNVDQKIKVRARSYHDTERKFFQVKHKSFERKNIYSIPYSTFTQPELTPHMVQLFNGIYSSVLNMQPNFIPIPLVRCTYNRCILYSPSGKERINIDFNIEFERYESPKGKKKLSGLILLENKALQEDLRLDNFITSKKIHHLKTFSKYSLGMHYIYDLPVSGLTKKTIKLAKKLKNK